ncbi:NF-X1-type zinc finger protein NFXL1-like [Diadema antillarum]|uniref:NF-X1-type zinc finger protein NFXL1-like n=1 Tax=Diadema antillarum TaxID=105358 RepID=UPI003A879AA3
MAASARPNRGRGRGRGRGGVAQEMDKENVFGQRRQRNSLEKTNVWSEPKTERNGPQQAAKHSIPKEPASHVNDKKRELVMDEDSSSDEEIDENIVNKMLQAYGGKLGDQGDGVLTESRQNLQEACQSGANDCSVCLGKIRRTDAIWTCDSCFISLHLQCIQKWAQEGILQASLQNEDGDSQSAASVWSCPNCRSEKPMSQCPRRYMCFCQKVVSPPPHPWLAPHSCGDTCGRALRPDCGHRCLLLCHPGACPPCPQTVKAKCHCGGAQAKLRRCSSRTWSCGKTCSKLLPCGQHRCTQICHAGDCLPCPHTSQQPCLCKKRTTLRECASPRWSCGEVCGKPLPCGHHRCERVCHEGECGDCPRSGTRYCPCGKTALQLQCTEDVPPCGDTCDKPLPCGVHRCTRRCHTGKCESCLQMSRKKCRCGAREKTLPCQEEYKCDHKCTKMRNCYKHQCKRRCCSGDCPPCEQKCNKYLPCGNHKCPSLCHPGRCYPCPLMVELKCRCGSAKMSVRCGREKTIKPPKCKKPCLIPPDCHHKVRDPHTCHFNKCPPCKQVCGKVFPCGHTCPKKCHSAVIHKNTENKGPRTPWQPAPKMVISTVNEPCPPCEHPVPVQCLGKHETSDLPCSRAKPFSCRRACGRVLACTNHTCKWECHEVTGSPDDTKAGNNCQECEEGCSKERPEGCRHHCRLPCHEGPCPPCKKTNKTRCHCKAMALYLECNAWLLATKTEREEMQSCKGPCPRELACGHPCSKTCHSGPCSDPQSCTFKVAKRCQCKRRKKEFYCHEMRAGNASVECDDTCKQQKAARQQKEEEKARKEAEVENLKQQKDLDEYNRLMNKKKKTRKRREIVEEETFIEKYGKKMLVVAGGAAILCFAAYLLLLQ